ncbi:hypothetical protein E0H51_13295 [Rhizobium leguminosarum bv. viciae]|nr:hypothetical protein E0H51_13295 [Rhizobium leguminosarum bv. viciae]TBZ11458.1 hypothetical protein E0H33_22135 [Rhizobium leguminosarum bv. viciae]
MCIVQKEILCRPWPALSIVCGIAHHAALRRAPIHKRLNPQPATAWISAWIGYISNIGLSEHNCNG